MAIRPQSAWLPTSHGPTPTPEPLVQGITIFKAPPHLRNVLGPDRATVVVDRETFQVKMLHLGLQNRTLEDLTSVIQNLKVEVAAALDVKLRSCTPAQTWDTFVGEVTNRGAVANRGLNLQELKAKYQECTQGMPDNAVEYHLALDALFLVFYFQFANDKKFNSSDFKSLAERRRATLESIGVADFLLLENQIPMDLLKAVMKKLCEISPQPPAQPPALAVSLDEYVRDELNKVLQVVVIYLFPFSEEALSKLLSYRLKRLKRWIVGENIGTRVDRFKLYLDGYFEKHLEDYKHILDCVYHVVCGHLPGAGPNLRQAFLENIPSATYLQKVGIKLKQSSGGCDLTTFKLESSKLHSAHLRMPKVTIYEDTQRKFRNLAIYEQLLGEHDIREYCGDFRCYLLLMDQLCRTPEDWQLLSERDVIEMQAGDQVVSDMWTRSMKGVLQPIPTSLHWANCYGGIRNHCQSWWGPWRRRNLGIFCCEQAWKWSSVLAAIFLLAMTGLQTYFTVVNSATSKLIWPPSVPRPSG